MTTFTEGDLRAALAADADEGSTPPDVWTPLHRRIVRRRRTRAGCGIVAAGVIASVVVINLPSRNDTAHLPVAGGPGGPTVLVPDQSLSDTELDTAVSVLRQRFDALDVSGVTISTHDGAIEVDAPSVDPAVIASVAVRGVLQYRLVWDAAPSAIDGSGPSTATTLDAAERKLSDTSCPTTAAGSAVDTTPTRYLVTCAAADPVVYLLGPSSIDHESIAGSRATQDPTTNQWLVQVNFNAAGSQDFHTLTAEAADNPEDLSACGPPKGCNAIAIVVDGLVLSAPSVQQRGGIEGGQTQITGRFTEAQAKALAAVASSSPLPTSFTVAEG